MTFVTLPAELVANACEKYIDRKISERKKIQEECVIGLSEQYLMPVFWKKVGIEKARDILESGSLSGLNCYQNDWNYASWTTDREKIVMSILSLCAFNFPITISAEHAFIFDLTS